MATSGTDTLDPASLQATLGPQLTAEQATLIFQQGKDAVVFALLDGQAIGRESSRCADRHRPGGTLGAGPTLRQADRQGAGQGQGGQAGTGCLEPESSRAPLTAQRPPPRPRPDRPPDRTLLLTCSPRGHRLPHG